ncbi:lytic transglycosylase domain-containing protein [Natronoflexus pectinivorans]|uniref:Transglycosylase-like protein with SLT domain n=1 Tax=Natronoflexus pectinivorans TaxID=682526 RepID=A0A4V2RW81_9BACT|nr:lytic transglycosylase domain-containing protein [Natronoflexus pectinivorans]TCO07192.1 transglycosylase-like protein with SLT domain [Natronoflexus pectinivorans]
MSKSIEFPVLKVLSVSTSVIAIVLVFNLFVQSSPPVNMPIGDDVEMSLFKQNYSIHALPIPDSLNFAGERVPLERTYVRESYDREMLVNTYWQSQTLLLIKRANRYFPVIEPILEAEGVPDDFKYLALIESGFLERAVSPAGAVGVWQFLAGTARDYGLEVNREVDERYHLEKSTVAAARYLKDSYERFGSWTLAAAAYNAGNRGITRQMTRQKADCYYDLLLVEETARYVFRILAIKEILSKPHEFGFHLGEDDLYYPIETYDFEVNGAIADFADFAIEHNTTYKELKDLNPWLRETFLTNSSGRKYTLKLPKQGAFIFGVVE